MAVGPGILEKKKSIDNDEIPPIDYNGKKYTIQIKKRQTFLMTSLLNSEL